VIDAAMNDLIRPAMYDAWHGIVPLAAGNAVGATSLVDVVGPICESSDTFAKGRALPSLPAGSRVAILDAGAYGAVMSSTYNARPQPAIAMVDGDRWTVIRKRQTYEDLWAGESVPDFL
jgi:diaminopimelate decarboxylase